MKKPRAKAPKKNPVRKQPASRAPRGKRDILVLAYDLGGTKISVGVVDARGRILTSHREPARISEGKEATLRQMTELGRELIRRYPEIRAVGVATAGPVDVAKGVLLDPTNFSGPDGHWGKVDLAGELRRRLKLPVIVENDAAAAILAERWKGAAAGYENSLILTLGTGLGTAAIANGELVRAGRGQHTEGGHMMLNAGDPSAPCGCGNRGCAEAYLSGRSFTRRARARLGKPEFDAAQITQLARRGDRRARKLFDEYSHWLSVALHNFAVLYCPEIVIFTGSFAAASDLFLKNAEKRLAKLLARRNEIYDLQPVLRVSSLDNQAGLLGGAYVALRSQGAGLH